jgi:hypothetical protein
MRSAGVHVQAAGGKGLVNLDAFSLSPAHQQPHGPTLGAMQHPQQQQQQHRGSSACIVRTIPCAVTVVWS